MSGVNETVMFIIRSTNRTPWLLGVILSYCLPLHTMYRHFYDPFKPTTCSLGEQNRLLSEILQIVPTPNFWMVLYKWFYMDFSHRLGIGSEYRCWYSRLVKLSLLIWSWLNVVKSGRVVVYSCVYHIDWSRSRGSGPSEEPETGILYLCCLDIWVFCHAADATDPGRTLSVTKHSHAENTANPTNNTSTDQQHPAAHTFWWTPQFSVWNTKPVERAAVSLEQMRGYSHN